VLKQQISQKETNEQKQVVEKPKIGKTPVVPPKP
jgi:hypothetical protein